MSEDPRNVLVCGTVKAATTSLFYWLARHPGVQPATVKETRFFLDPAYPLPRVIAPTGQVSAYQEFFPEPARNRWRLDATPFYLYSRGCAQRIHRALPDSRLIFVLRHPADRLLSHFRYLKQIGTLPKTESFDDYVREALDRLPQDTEYPPDPVGMGLYSRYLPEFYEVFGPNRILVLSFEALKQNPRPGMQELSDFLGLENIYGEDFDFEIFNPGQTGEGAGVLAALNSIRNHLVRYTFRHPRVHGVLRSAKHAVERKLASSTPSPPVEMSMETAQALAKLYADEAGRVGECTGTVPDWKDAED